MTNFSTSIELANLGYTALGLFGSIGACVILYYACATYHDWKYRAGKRGPPFDHNDARGVGILSIPILLIGALFEL